MAVSYFYPSPEINVGKPFLAEYLTSFLNQRKEDHKEMIARKLKALDPSKLIDLEQGHIKNIGILQKQIAQIEREGLQAQSRLETARTKAAGAVDVQREARLGRFTDTQGKIIAGLYKSAMDGAARYERDHRPGRADIDAAMNRIGPNSADDVATANLYVSNLDAHLSRMDDEVKQEWLVIAALGEAKRRGHGTAVAQIQRKYASIYGSVRAPDPMAHFRDKYPQLDPLRFAEKMAKSALSQLPAASQASALSIIEKQIEKDRIRGPVGGVGGVAGASASGQLKRMLATEMLELQRVRGERREMQAEYQKTALSSYMKSWIAPSYTKEPAWQRDWQVLGGLGQVAPTKFENWMTEYVQPARSARTGAVDWEEVQDLQSYPDPPVSVTGAGAWEGEGGHAGDPQSVRALSKLIRDYRQAVSNAGGRLDHPESFRRLVAIYQMVSTDPDGQRYGQVGRLVLASIKKAHNVTRDYGENLNEMLDLAGRGEAAIGYQEEHTRTEGRPAAEARMGAEAEERRSWPYRDTVDSDLEHLKGMSLEDLRAWGKRAYDRYVILQGRAGTDPDSQAAAKRMQALLNWTFGKGDDPPDAPSLVKVKLAEAAVAKLEPPIMRPDFSAEKRALQDQRAGFIRNLSKTIEDVLEERGLSAWSSEDAEEVAQLDADWADRDAETRAAIKEIDTKLDELSRPQELSEPEERAIRERDEKAAVAAAAVDAAREALAAKTPQLPAPKVAEDSPGLEVDSRGRPPSPRVQTPPVSKADVPPLETTPADDLFPEVR